MYAAISILEEIINDRKSVDRDENEEGGEERARGAGEEGRESTAFIVVLLGVFAHAGEGR